MQRGTLRADDLEAGVAFAESDGRLLGDSLGASHEEQPVSLPGRLCTQLEDQVRTGDSLW